MLTSRLMQQQQLYQYFNTGPGPVKATLLNLALQKGMGYISKKQRFLASKMIALVVWCMV